MVGRGTRLAEPRIQPLRFDRRHFVARPGNGRGSEAAVAAWHRRRNPLLPWFCAQPGATLPPACARPAGARLYGYAAEQRPVASRHGAAGRQPARQDWVRARHSRRSFGGRRDPRRDGAIGSDPPEGHHCRKRRAVADSRGGAVFADGQTALPQPAGAEGICLARAQP